ncbi:MAG: flippase [Thermoleophilia bacterium]|nr:flippase [Thermoleophilia bacterium]
MARACPPAATDRRLPLHLRPHARATVAAVSDPRSHAQDVGHALPRLRYSRKNACATRLWDEGRGRDRRQLRRDPLGSRSGRNPAGNRPRRHCSRTALRPDTPGDPACALFPGSQGYRARDRRGRRARRRPRDRRGPPSRGGVRAVPERGHRRRSAQRRLVRALRDRVHGARQARRHLPARGGGATDRAGLRNDRADRVCNRRHPPRAAAAPRRRCDRTETAGRSLTRLRRGRSRSGAGHRPPPRRLRSTLMALSGQLSRLGKQSTIYGLGGLVSRILAVLLLPLYTRYLTTGDYGEIETLVALVTVLTIVLRCGISPAFFRFYFDSDDHDTRRLVLRTSFWFTMGMATLGLVAVVALAAPISEWLFGNPDAANLVRASAVALWAQMNYEQMTALFRVEERPVSFVVVSLTNVVLTIAGTLLLVVVLDKGPLGVIVGNFTGTLIVYLALLGYRREQLGLQLDRGLLRRMNHFGMPLVPSALLLWVTNFSDRFFLVKLTDTSEVGLYSVGVRVASAMVLLLTAFRTAWPAFAYSIKSDEEARNTYAWVLTYLVVLTTWIATALTLLSPWLVAWLTTPEFASASRVVGPLAFAAVSFGGFIVISIGIGRARRTQFTWVVTGIAAVVNVTLNLVLIPRYGMMGAAIATVAAYTVMFAGMAWWAQRIFPCPYQWRRVLTAAAAGIALASLGKVVGGGLPVCAVLILAYPLALLPLGFYLPAERRRLWALVARS